MTKSTVLALTAVGLTLAACGGGSSYRNDNYDHDVVYRTPAYGEDRHVYYDADGDYDDDEPDGVFYHRPGYTVAPVARYGTVYDDDDRVIYYYRD